MHYYPHHIGDFRSGTVNMSRQSRWIYRDLMDVYYDSEKPLPLDLDEICDSVGVESDDERRLVERLLRFKFLKTADGYRHERCDAEIAAYHHKAEIARANGKGGGRPRKPSATDGKPTGFPSGSKRDADSPPTASGSKANQEPRTNNQEPEKPEEQSDQTGPSATPDLLHAAPAQRDASAQGTRLPKDWALPVEWKDWAVAERPDWPGGHAERVAAAFRDYWVAVPGKAGRKADWQATWRNWVRKERGAGGPPQGKQTNSNGADRHGNFGAQDYRAGVTADGFF